MLVLFLDEQPVFLVAALARLHAHQRPSSLHALAVNDERQLAADVETALGEGAGRREARAAESGRLVAKARKLAGEFTAAGRTFPSRSYVIPMNQPYASFAQTMLEEQIYPDLFEYPGGPPARPYDVTAHTLPLLMNVEAVPIEQEGGRQAEHIQRTLGRAGFVDVDRQRRLGAEQPVELAQLIGITDWNNSLVGQRLLVPVALAGTKPSATLASR